MDSRLIAELSLNLVPDLWKLLVTAQFAASECGHHFLARHSEAQIPLKAVFEAEHVVAHDIPASGFLLNFSGVQRRQEHLLRADAIHLFADDLLEI